MPDFNQNQLSIDAFKQNFVTGARPYLFYVDLQLPPEALNVPAVGNITPMRFLVRATRMPGTTVQEIITPWQGFDYKVGGKRDYPNWDVTFHVDRYARIRKQMLAWQDLILNPLSNMTKSPDAYLSLDQTVTLLGTDNYMPIMKYTMKYAWPTTVGDLNLDYGTTGEFASFDVSFAYTYFQVSDS